MNFGELKTEFYARGFNYLDDNGTGEIRAGKWINQGYLRLCWEEEWFFTKATATGTAPLQITDLGAVLQVNDTTNNNQLLSMEERALSDITTDLTQTGVPSWWYLNNDTITVYPVSAVNLKVRYHKIPVELSDDTDEPVIPARYHDLIVDAAVLKAYKDNDNWESYQGLKSIYNDDLEAMRHNLAKTELDRTERIRVVRGSDEWCW